jgi:hypothetical protein
MEGQTEVYGLPFPLVFVPRSDKINFVQLQEFFLANHKKILECASEFGAVMFKGFDVISGEEWASVMYKSGLKEAAYL